MLLQQKKSKLLHWEGCFLQRMRISAKIPKRRVPLLLLVNWRLILMMQRKRRGHPFSMLRLFLFYLQLWKILPRSVQIAANLTQKSRARHLGGSTRCLLLYYFLVQMIVWDFGEKTGKHPSCLMCWEHLLEVGWVDKQVGIDHLPFYINGYILFVLALPIYNELVKDSYL